MELKIETLSSAVVKISNASDEARDYTVRANVTLTNEQRIKSIDLGTVSVASTDSSDEKYNVVANFSWHGNDSLSIKFANLDADSRQIVLTKIEEFINGVPNVASSITIQ
jgi:hypothetical protein